MKNESRPLDDIDLQLLNLLQQLFTMTARMDGERTVARIWQECAHA